MPYKDKTQQRAYQKAWTQKRRSAWFAGKVCVDCGTAEALELDHVDAQQKVSHRIWTWADDRRFAELAKCVPRCIPCHRKKTLAQGEYLKRAKVTRDQVLEIRQRYSTGDITQTQLGEEFGLKQAAVSKIVLGLRWG